MLQENEQCDDGNTLSRDGCDNNCFFETAWACTTPLCNRSVCTLKRPPFRAFVQKTVSQTGGVVDSRASGVILRIPVNSVEVTEVVFSVGTSNATQCQDLYMSNTQTGILMVSPCYTFGPEGIEFRQPVQISIEIHPNEDRKNEDHFIHRYNPSLQLWELFETSGDQEMISEKQSYTTKTRHFSTYALFYRRPKTLSSNLMVLLVSGIIGVILLCGILVCVCIVCRYNTKVRTQHDRDKTRHSNLKPPNAPSTPHYAQNIPHQVHKKHKVALNKHNVGHGGKYSPVHELPDWELCEEHRQWQRHGHTWPCHTDI